MNRERLVYLLRCAACNESIAAYKFKPSFPGDTAESLKDVLAEAAEYIENSESTSETDSSQSWIIPKLREGSVLSTTKTFTFRQRRFNPPTKFKLLRKSAADGGVFSVCDNTGTIITIDDETLKDMLDNGCLKWTR